MSQAENCGKVYRWKTKPTKVQYKALKKALRRGCLGVFFETRVGKSKVAVDFCGALYTFEGVRRAVIVSPLAVRMNWVDQIETHLSDDVPRHIEVFDPKKTDLRKEYPKNVLVFLLVTYDQLWRYKQSIAKWSPQVMVMDECHKIKNRNTRRSRAAAFFGAAVPYRLGLSGTPYTKLEDVFGQFRFIDRSLFGSSWVRFRDSYCIMGGYMGKQIVGYQNEDYLLKMLAEGSVVAQRRDVMEEPEFEIIPIRVPLEPKARAIYDKLRKEYLVQLDSGEHIAPSIKLTLMLRLLQIAGGFVSTDEGTIRRISTAKFNYCKDLVSTILDEGKKVVIFAKFLPEIQALSAAFPESVVIHGGIPEAQRLEARLAFQNDPSTSVIIVQIDSGGEGVSLAAAHNVIFYSLSYSLTSYIQAKSRVLGREQQSGVVTYYHLMAENTLDENLTKGILRGEDYTSLTTEKLRELLSQK